MPADPAQLPPAVADLLDKTLGKRPAPGVLADFLDDHSPHWAAFAAALRASQPYKVKKNTGANGFRYREVCPGVCFWLSTLHHAYPSEDKDVIVGAYRYPPGEPGMWRRVVRHADLTPELRAGLLSAIGEPDPPKKPRAKKPATKKKPTAKKPSKKKS